MEICKLDDLHWAWERKYSFWHRTLMLTAGYPKALIPFHVPTNIPSTSTWPVCTIPFSIDSRCLLQIDIYICICSLSSPPHIYVSKCMYVYVHISLFLPECACTTIIDISPRIFKLICCCCVSIIIVICIVVVYKS